MSLDYFVELAKQVYPQNTDEFTTRYHWLMAEEQEQEARRLRDRWSESTIKVSLDEPDGKIWQIIARPQVDLASLPPDSWFLQFTFTLARPYISKDDNPFYVIDNPIVRDKVFRLPMVRSTAWKGSLYAALWQLGHDKKDGEQKQREQMQRLFGIANDTDNTGQSGHLYFYPTFFTQTSLEIINPHDRERRVGKNPILFESVPADAKGTFTLLYVPLDRIGKDEDETKQQALADLRLIAEGLQAMFTVYGFGAKTSSGFGVAKERVKDGRIQTNIPDEVHPANPPQEPVMSETLRIFMEQFPGEDFNLKPNEWRKQHSATNAQRKQYMNARAAHAVYKKAGEDYQAALAAWQAQTAEPAQSFVGDSFSSFADLIAKATNLIQPGDPVRETRP